MTFLPENSPLTSRLDENTISFRGCESSEFSVREIVNLDSDTREYRITYPANTKRYSLAPLVHELAHIVQMKRYGGFANLRGTHDSLRIELGADFLTGIIYRKYIGKEYSNDFELSTGVRGLYREESINAHGSPSQRSAAYSIGYYSDSSHTFEDLSDAESFFQDEIYGSVKNR